MWCQMIKDFCDRLAEWAAENNLKQIDVARITGASKGLVSKWFSGEKKPGSTYLVRLSEASGKSVSWWITGNEGKIWPEISGAVSFAPRKVPVISVSDADRWINGNAEDVKIIGHKETSAMVSHRGFAIVMDGDSMTSQADRRSIADGATVVVDPEFDKDSINRKIVVAVMGSVDTAIKELVRDGGNTYLFSLNHRYHPIDANENCKIIGVAKQIITDL